MADRVFSYEFRGKFDNLRSGLAASSKAVGDFSDKLTAADRNGAKMRAGLTTLGGAAGKVGLVAAAGLGAAVVASANFEQAMSGVKAATHETADNMDLLREAAIKSGADTAFSASEAAAGIENLAKAGVSTGDILGGGLAGALDLAAAGELSVADAAETAATALTQFNLAGEDVPHVADLLAAGAGKAQGDVADLGMALKQSGLVAAQMGLSIEETTGSLSAFASAGLLGSDAGTAFKSMLLRLAKPSKEAATTMAELGISAYDAQGNLVSMSELAGQLQVAFEGQTQAQRDTAFATIFGTDAIRAANVLYTQGSSGITDWTNKVDDAGYAAETAATRLDNLRGDLEALGGSLETALIGAGDGSQGPLRSLVQNATDAVNVFNDLPPGIQSATTAAAGLVAVTGGSLWFGSKVIGGIASTRQALQDLGITAGQTKTALKGIGKGIEFGVILLGIELVDRAFDDLFDRNFDDAGLMRNLEALADGRVVENLGEIGQKVANLNAEGLKATDTAFGWLPGETTFEEANREVEKIDQALAALVETGDQITAAKIFSQITDQASELGVSMDDIRGSFDAYAVAVANARSEANGFSGGFDDFLGTLSVLPGAVDSAASATDGLAAANQRSAKAAQNEAAALRDAIDASREKRAASLGAFDAETRWGQALAAATKQAKESKAGLSRLTEEGRTNRATISELAAAWNNQSDAVKNTEGRFKNAKAAFIQTAIDMGVPKKAAEELAAKLLEIPPKRHTKVEADTASADARVKAHAELLRALDGKTANTYTNHYETTIYKQLGARVAGYGGAGGILKADGGYISGPGGPRDDLIPARLSNGEYVMQAAAVRRYGIGMMDALNAQRFANGGPVQRFANGGAAFNPNVRRDGFDEFRQQVREFERAMRRLGRWSAALEQSSDKMIRLGKQYDKMSTSLKQEKSELRSSVLGTFDNDPFGNGLAGFDLQVKANRNDARSMREALKKARKKGLDGALFRELAASGDLNTAQQFAGLSFKQIRQREKWFGQQNFQQQRLANFAVGRGFDREERTLRQLDRSIDRLERRLKGLGGAVESGARKGIAERERNGAQRRRAGR